jgi:hypothetical protein
MVKRVLIWAGMVAVAAAVGCDLRPAATVDTRTPEQKEASAAKEREASMIHEGMTLEEVERQLGKNGAEMFSSSTNVDVEWYNHPHSISVMFKIGPGGKLTAMTDGAYLDNSVVEPAGLEDFQREIEIGKKKLEDRKQGKRLHETNSRSASGLDVWYPFNVK